MDAEPVATSRFASIVNLARNARATFERFPFTLLTAFGAALMAHYLIETDFESGDAAMRVLVTAILGIPLLFSLRVLAEGRRWSRTVGAIAAAAGLVALFLFYLSLSESLIGADVYRFFLLVAAAHLFASFAPFLVRRGQENGFWQYNRSLLLRFTLAAFYSLVLFIGLSLALLACETLLEFDIEGHTYGQLWVWIAFLYNTWFFLAGIPEDFEALEQDDDYPTGLRIFTQYVLIPLVAVYLVILYAYVIRIIVEWDLPKGWVTYPVIGVSITGMLALLLVYPIRGRSGSAWISHYAHLFFWTLYPLIVLVAVAIWTRIAEYGVTERRYLVVVATGWLLGIALYFTLRQTRDIRTIPLSLCAVSLLAVLGPWSGTSVSKLSQLDRLRDLLTAEQVMTGGALDAEAKNIPFEQEHEISSIVRYLDDVHGLEAIRNWYARGEDLPDELTPSVALEKMGLNYRARWESAESFDFNITPPSPLSVAGFDYMYNLMEHGSDRGIRESAELDSTTFLTLSGTVITIGDPADPASQIRIDLAPRLLDLRAKRRAGSTLDQADGTLIRTNPAYRAVIHLANVGADVAGDSLTLRHINARVLVDVRRR
ncbi:MAG: DUF4153 domain-containing protein [Gemmatimonadetes bacterium]|uniref:DUF4153 domain-containing protein n=1 Tax=Candidatus Kutchimonas denitrificans TaxID=3056748 RepID=A0AAE4Z5P1_9BACT|nr:DUF4153 domain-containing protein [Gemmatimonadota bacterium]NIR74033.1 DUF4153 domain-containing protein [Candidatus Kutchimonas denitrificans]NIS03022.1 DUF4153 domain-containing protein [Gemmatimonadota bacterium]NIT68739.1 DUF4153 domain-containing protein [Gemmatimonadota bacterium]NIU53320.1 DUF4153 domain-containing protein [Gemmatimonadota bacterium]